MGAYTRREILQFLSMAFPLSFLHCSKSDVFSDERVCIHVFNLEITIPEPLLQGYQEVPKRKEFENFFNVGIAELLVCTTTSRFLDMFQYFWPITKNEFKRIDAEISIQFSKFKFRGIQDIKECSQYLTDHASRDRSKDIGSAILFTFNDYTKILSSNLINVWQRSMINELVIFKDPAKAPYLCDYLSLQKGFKRPPP